MSRACLGFSRFVLIAALACSCSDDVTVAPSSTAASSTGGPSCTDTRGTLSGDVWLFAPPGDPNSQPASKALVQLRQMAGETPLTAMADDQGHYEVELPAGDWIVSGEDGTGCFTLMSQTVHLEACGTTTLDLVLEECTG